MTIHTNIDIIVIYLMHNMVQNNQNLNYHYNIDKCLLSFDYEISVNMPYILN